MVWTVVAAEVVATVVGSTGSFIVELITTDEVVVVLFGFVVVVCCCFGLGLPVTTTTAGCLEVDAAVGLMVVPPAPVLPTIFGSMVSARRQNKKNVKHFTFSAQTKNLGERLLHHLTDLAIRFLAITRTLT